MGDNWVGRGFNLMVIWRRIRGYGFGSDLVGKGGRGFLNFRVFFWFGFRLSF